MTGLIALLAVLSIAMSVAAQFLLKAGMSSASVQHALQAKLPAWQAALAVMGNVQIIGGFSLYALGAVVWLAVLSRWDVSKAYPMVGLGFVATAFIGWWLGEAVTPSRLAGIAMISVGVVLVARS